MTRHPFSVRIIETLRNEPAAHYWCEKAFSDGLAARHWPPRAAPTGNECCAIATLTATRRICAMATYFPIENNRVWVDLMFVAPENRRWGIGTQLLAAIRATVESGTNEIMFGTGLDNAAMRRVAQAAGYEPDHVVYSLKTGAAA